jgi:hypothetical protein
LWSVASVQARNIYVNNTGGDDRYTGREAGTVGDTSGPVRSIAKALRLAQPGDHVVLADTGQTYHESVSVVGARMSGYAGHPFVIEGNGAVLDGSALVRPDTWQSAGGAIFFFRPPLSAHQQLLLDGKPAARVAVSQTATKPPALEAKQWCLCDGKVYFCVEPTKLPQDYRLSYAALQTGITLYHGENVEIKNLKVQGFQLDGINVQNSARRIHLSVVTCQFNGRAGVVSGGASQVELDGCRLAGNAVAQLLTQPQSETHVWGSDLPNEMAPAWADQGGHVWLGDAAIQGGREAIKADDAPRKTEPDKRPADPDKKPAKPEKNPAEAEPATSEP